MLLRQLLIFRPEEGQPIRLDLFCVQQLEARLKPIEGENADLSPVEKLLRAARRVNEQKELFFVPAPIPQNINAGNLHLSAKSFIGIVAGELFERYRRASHGTALATLHLHIREYSLD